MISKLKMDFSKYKNNTLKTGLILSDILVCSILPSKYPRDSSYKFLYSLWNYSICFIIFAIIHQKNITFKIQIEKYRKITHQKNVKH